MRAQVFVLLLSVCLAACNQAPAEQSENPKSALSKTWTEIAIIEAVKNFPAKGKDNRTYLLTTQLERFKDSTCADFKKLAQEETDYQSKRIWQAFHDSYKQMTYEWHASELNPGLWEVLLILHQPSPGGDDITQERTFIVDTNNKTIRGNSQSCQFLDENLTGVFRPNEGDKSERCRFEMTNL